MSARSKASAALIDKPPQATSRELRHQSEAGQAEAAVARDLPELMTIKDFLRYYRISRASFYREVRANRLKTVKFGKATRITRRDAEAWMASLPPVVLQDR